MVVVEVRLVPFSICWNLEGSFVHHFIAFVDDLYCGSMPAGLQNKLLHSFAKSQCCLRIFHNYYFGVFLCVLHNEINIMSVSICRRNCTKSVQNLN